MLEQPGQGHTKPVGTALIGTEVDSEISWLTVSEFKYGLLASSLTSVGSNGLEQQT